MPEGEGWQTLSPSTLLFAIPRSIRHAPLPSVCVHGIYVVRILFSRSTVPEQMTRLGPGDDEIRFAGIVSMVELRIRPMERLIMVTLTIGVALTMVRLEGNGAEMRCLRRRHGASGARARNRALNATCQPGRSGKCGQ